MKKYALSIMLFFALCLGKKAYSLTAEDEAVASAVAKRMVGIISEMADEYSKCGVLYLRLYLSNKDLVDKIKEANEFYQKSQNHIFNAWKLGDYLQRDRDEVVKPDAEIDINDAQKVADELRKCTIMSSNHKAFFRKKSTRCRYNAL